MKKSKNNCVSTRLQFYLQKATSHLLHLPPRKEFIRWIKCALAVVPHNHKNLEMTIRLVDEEEGARLNQTYRHKRNATNVLSFGHTYVEGMPLMMDDESEIYYLGDLVICVPLVLQEAREQGKSELAHWTHLTIHGVLHLLGYDHIKKSEAAIMEGLEVEILRQLGYEDPYVLPS